MLLSCIAGFGLRHIGKPVNGNASLWRRMHFLESHVCKWKRHVRGHWNGMSIMNISVNTITITTSRQWNPRHFKDLDANVVLSCGTTMFQGDDGGRTLFL